MAKKKSKTQKYKKNLKKKLQKESLNQNNKLKTQTKSKNTNSKTTNKPKENNKVNTPKTKTNNKTSTKKNNQNKSVRVVDKNKVNYNVVLNEETKKKKKIQDETKKESTKKPKLEDKNKVIYNIALKTKELEEKEKKKETKKLIKEEINIAKNNKVDNKEEKEFNLKELFKNFKSKLKNLNKKIKDKHEENKIKRFVNKAKKENDLAIKNSKNLKEEITEEDLKERKRQIKRDNLKRKNIFFRIIITYIENRHILYNAILIVIFIILLLGLIRIDVFSASTITYISCITGFLILVAISYNKYFSGKLFTILISAGMIFAIYQMQYTYDFINNFNTSAYESKTYYVVAIDSTKNKSIYNINNKKVGLLKDNSTNIERKLDTKLDKVDYIEYDDMDQMFNDFYKQNIRAVLVNENQYIYMLNKINENSRNVKILYEFKVNEKIDI